MDQKLKASIKAAIGKASDWKDFFGFLLAVIAIAFAIIQFSDSRLLLERTSTRYIGSFPDNLDNINRLIDRSHKELLVLADFPGYGLYSTPDKFDDYNNNILKLRHKTPFQKIRMLIYSSKEQERKLRQEQFDQKSWVKIKTSPGFENFFRTYHPGMKIPETYDLFINDLLSLQAQFERSLCDNGVEIEHIDQPSTIFFWLDVGGSGSAVFAINNGAGADRELSFRTQDGRLIDSFQSMFNRLWNYYYQRDPQSCHPGPG